MGGHKVIHSHINEGRDFFKTRLKKDPDYIVSNPPYSLKTEVLEELFKNSRIKRNDIEYVLLCSIAIVPAWEYN